MPPSVPPERPDVRRMPVVGGHDLVVGQRARGGGEREAVADLDALDRLDAHQRAGQPRVEAAVPVHVRAEARRQPVDDDLDDAAEGVAVLVGLVDRARPSPRGVGVEAAHRVVVERAATSSGCGHGRRAARATPPSSTTWRDDPGADGLLEEVRTRPRPSATRAAVSRAEARSRIGRASSKSYFCMPTRSAWPGRGRVSAALRASAVELGRVDRVGRHHLLPLGPLGVADLDRDRPALGLAVPDAADERDLVLLELHPGAAAVAEPAPGQRVGDVVGGHPRRGRAAPRGSRPGRVRGTRPQSASAAWRAVFHGRVGAPGARPLAETGADRRDAATPTHGAPTQHERRRTAERAAGAAVDAAAAHSSAARRRRQQEPGVEADQQLAPSRGSPARARARRRAARRRTPCPRVDEPQQRRRRTAATQPADRRPARRSSVVADGDADQQQRRARTAYVGAMTRVGQQAGAPVDAAPARPRPGPAAAGTSSGQTQPSGEPISAAGRPTPRARLPGQPGQRRDVGVELLGSAAARSSSRLAPRLAVRDAGHGSGTGAGSRPRAPAPAARRASAEHRPAARGGSRCAARSAGAPRRAARPRAPLAGRPHRGQRRRAAGEELDLQRRLVRPAGRARDDRAPGRLGRGRQRGRPRVVDAPRRPPARRRTARRSGVVLGRGRDRGDQHVAAHRRRSPSAPTVDLGGAAGARGRRVDGLRGALPGRAPAGVTRAAAEVGQGEQRPRPRSRPRRAPSPRRTGPSYRSPSAATAPGHVGVVAAQPPPSLEHARVLAAPATRAARSPTGRRASGSTSRLSGMVSDSPRHVVVEAVEERRPARLAAPARRRTPVQPERVVRRPVQHRRQRVGDRVAEDRAPHGCGHASAARRTGSRSTPDSAL